LGATGRVGQFAVSALRARDIKVIALARDPMRAARVLPQDVRCTPGDLAEPPLPPGLMDGVDGVLFVAGGVGGSRSNPRAVDDEAVGAIADAALTAGVRHMVLLSSAGVTQPEHPHNCTFNSILKWKKRGEDRLRASGLPFTIVRALGLRDRPGGLRPVRVVKGDRIAFGEDIARADVGALLADIAALCVGAAPADGAALAPGLDYEGVLNQTFEIYNDATLPFGQTR
jgi:uncharacterized protein YbjT (DUF2867 family)